jgi:hypothetical protein
MDVQLSLVSVLLISSVCFAVESMPTQRTLCRMDHLLEIYNFSQELGKWDIDNYLEGLFS